jgi:hypothetical protein
MWPGIVLSVVATAAFAARVLPVPQRQEIRALRGHVGDVSDHLNYGSFKVAPPPGPPSR